MRWGACGSLHAAILEICSLADGLQSIDLHALSKRPPFKTSATEMDTESLAQTALEVLAVGMLIRCKGPKRGSAPHVPLRATLPECTIG